jgi:RNA-directed DNA polymerase
VFDSVCGVIQRRLKLKVNREKSSIRHAAEATLLGIRVLPPRRAGQDLTRPGDHAAERQATRSDRRKWGVSMDYRIGAINRFTTGWMAYFRLADSASPFRDLDEWLRRHLRQIHWKHWKPPPLSGTTCGYAVSPSTTPDNGPAAARDTGGSPAPGSSTP